MTGDEQLAIFTAGWSAMKWLAKHAKTDCRDCAAYHRRVAAGHKSAQELHRRCALARRMHGQYMAVERMLLEVNDGFECDLVDPKRPDIRCDGDADWALAEWDRRKGNLISFVIGCQAHVRHAEARAIVSGSSGTFSIERLEDVVRHGADKMR